ncbi:MAG: molybdate ABC transporter substrate-binding protein [Opitutales bacterium]|jgi:molybdate transport system substrate-binding protein
MNSHVWWSVVLLCGMAASARAQEVVVSAAASLKDALTELAPMCKQQTGVTLSPNFGASGILARQIEAGAPVDIFISADDATMDGLEKAGLLAAGTRAPLLGNALVFVAPVASMLKMDGPAALEQPEVKRIAAGEPKTVPAGHYAQLYLQQAKVWDAVKEKIVPLDNVRTVLSATAAGNADVGIVYRTDALTEPRVRVIWTVPAGQGPAIHYPIAILKGTSAAAAAAKVREFLLSDAAGAVFARDGFTLPPRTGAPAKAP